MPLNRAAILVVEDEVIIGMALALAIRQMGGEVVGPATSVKAATRLLESSAVMAAIVDFNLGDGLATPVVEALMARSIPVIVQTGVGIPGALAARYPDLRVRIKPVLAEALVAELEMLLADCATTTQLCHGATPH